MIDKLHVVCPHCDTTNRVLRDRMESGVKCGQCRQALFPGHPVELRQANFERHVMTPDILVVVDFWAPWCGPCRAMAPAFERAAARFEPHVRLAKLNTEEEPGMAARFDIRAIPTLIAFQNGREVARQSGALDLENLLTWIEAHAATAGAEVRLAERG